MSLVKISTGYEPRPLQLVLHNSFKRFNIVVCHRAFGKTVLCLNEMVDRAFRNTKKNPTYVYIAPTYGQAKRVAWEGLKEAVRSIPGYNPNETELKIDIDRPANGDRVRFILLGAENPGSLRGIHIDGAILDEFAEMDPTIWSQIVRPMLTTKQGWVIFIGTPKGENHFAQMYYTARKQMSMGDREWFAALYKASETGIIPIGELEAARLTMGEEEYQQEMECSFSAAQVGAYYGKLIEKAYQENRIKIIPHEPGLQVFTCWDLGVDDSTAIWFGQRLGGREYRWIDYLENSGEGLDWYAKELLAKKYNYEEHYLPHDVKVREMGTAGAATRLDTLKKLGLKRATPVPRRSLEEGISASRLIIAKSWFDVEKCARGILALKNYERKWDAKNSIFQSRPLHNWASHGADAFRTGAVGMDDFSVDEKQKRGYRENEYMCQNDYKIL